MTTPKHEFIASLWTRAVDTIGHAKWILPRSPDTAANRAYYSAFYAVSALFAVDEMYFKKHTGLRAAVHRDLIHTGRWSESLGEDYDNLIRLRDVADYGLFKHVDEEEAAAAVAAAERIILAVHNENPGLFVLRADTTGPNPV